MAHEARRIAVNVAKLPEVLLDSQICDILPMPGLALDTGKTHEAAGFHITYWQRGRRMAALCARSGYQKAAVDRPVECWLSGYSPRR